MSSCQVTIESRVALSGASIEIVRHEVASPGELLFRHHDCIVGKQLYSHPHSLKNQVWVPIDKTEQCFEMGTTALQPPDLPLRVPDFCAGTYRRIRCCISAERFQSVTGPAPNWSQLDLRRCLNLNDPAIDECLWHLAQELVSPGLASKEFAEAYCNLLLIHIARLLKPASTQAAQLTAGLLPWQLNRITSYLGTFRGEAPTVEDLATQCGISSGHLSRVFKQAIGQTVHQYVAHVRLQRAKTLLLSSDLTLKQIAWTVGYASASSFCAAFARAMGEPPSRFRRRLRIGRGTTQGVTQTN